MAEAKIYYSIKGDIVDAPKLTINYDKRLPDTFENVDSDIRYDGLISLVAKSFFVRIDSSSKLSSDVVQLQGINSSWLNVQTKSLEI